jgi:hypothetical protein
MMGRKHVIRELDDAQFTFVIEAIIAGLTDREICAGFEKQFGQPLAKSSLNRWRLTAGNELAERYRLARYQAKQLLADLKQEDADKYQVMISNIEDRLLAATREVISKDPVQLLRIRQEEEKRRLKERELALKEKQLEFNIKQAERADSLLNDRLEIAASTWKFILFWFASNDPTGADYLTSRSTELLNGLQEHIQTSAP